MSESAPVSVIFLGDEGSGKTTLLASLARYFALNDLPNQVFYEDLCAPRRRFVGSASNPDGNGWIGGAHVRAVTCAFHGRLRSFDITDTAGDEQLCCLAAMPDPPDAAVLVINGRTGMGRNAIGQLRALGILGISQVILYISLFGQARSAKRISNIRVESEQLVEDYTGRWPVKCVLGNYREAVEQMEAHPKGPFGGALSELDDALDELRKRPPLEKTLHGKRLPCLVMNLEDTVTGVASVPDGSGVTVYFPETRQECGAHLHFLAGPENHRLPPRTLLRSGECAEAELVLDREAVWTGGGRLNLHYNGALRLTAIAAARSGFLPFTD